MFVFSRAFWLVVGFVLGLAASWSVARRFRRAVARYAPAEVRDRVAGTVHELRRDVSDAVDEGRAAARRREMELRARMDRPPAVARSSAPA